MHITQESDYAIRIILCLAQHQCRMDARTISEEMKVSLRFALKILGKLVSSNIAVSYKGNRGGYELARPSNEITLLDVIQAVEGSYMLSRCLDECGVCNRKAAGVCAFRPVFQRISDQVNQELAAVTFEDLAKGKTLEA